MSTYEERLHIAKESIKAIRNTVNAIQSYMGFEVRAHWNGRVKVDGELFCEKDLKNENNVKQRSTTTKKTKTE